MFKNLEVKYEYDTAGRETARVYRNGVRQETLYDRAGRVVLIKETNTYRDILRAEGYLYDEQGRRAYGVDEAGNVTVYKYDNQSRLSAVLYPWTDEISAADRREAAESGLFFSNDKGSPERFSVPLEDLAKLRELLNKTGFNRGSLAMFNQLLWRQTFAYDANGNRASKTSPWGTIRYEYDAENRMVKKGNITYTYDKDGNLLSETGGYRSAEYRYNGQNRMAYSEVTDHTNGAVSASEYAYDAFGRRTVTQDAGRTAMRTLYDGFTFEVIRDSETFQYGGFTVKGSPGIVTPSSPVQGVDDSSRFRLVTEGYSTWLPDGAPQGRANGEAAVPAERKYVGISATLWANGEAVAVNRYDTATFTGGTVYLGKDVMGTVRGISNDYGLLEDRYEYDAFGKPYKGDMNSGMNLGYTGKPYDTATGMYNYGYRDYQPEVARFTTVDPIRDGANWFAYVNNDPVNWVDMWGLDILAINNRDPTPGADVIIDSQNNDVGHTWASLHEDDGTLKQEYGWGYSSGNPFDGQTLSGALLGNGENGTATSTYTKSITPEEAATIDSLWNDKVNAGTGYNYGGQTLVPNSTFCTEAVIDVLNRSGVLTPEESAIINAPYDQWSNSFPSPLPSDLQKAAALLGNSTAPNPNAFEDRIGQLNAQKAANTSNTASQKGR